MKKIILALFVFTNIIIGQAEGDIIINEIGNGGTKKSLYSGGDYVELLILKDEGVKLAGWFLTDLSNPNGTPKETEGYVKFSDKEGSIFNQILPKGTYVLICIGDDRESYGKELQKEITELKNGLNKIVVFTESYDNHVEIIDGTIGLTAKDNVALVSSWDKKSAVDIVTWEGATSWSGAEVTELSVDQLENGEIVYFVPSGAEFMNNTSSANWVSTSKSADATPGAINKNVNGNSLK